MILWLWSVAQAATLVVDPSSSAAYPTISAAISAASSGDTLSIAEGTYAECLNTGGKSLSLVGAGLDSTILDGAGCGNGLLVQSGETVALADLGMRADGGRGIYVYYSALSLTRVSLTGMGAPGLSGGALAAEGSRVALADCVLSGNQGDYGGAVYLAWYNTLTDTGSTWEDNTGLYGGGAIYTGAYDVLNLDGSAFEDNQAPGGGGGAVAAIWAWGLAIDGARFSANSASGSGGAVQTYALDAGITVANATFTDNHTDTHGGAFESEWYSELAIADSAFTGNTASAYGGAVFTYVLDAQTLSGSRFCTNEAAYGGAVSAQWATTDALTNNVFVENRADQGGALHRYADGAGSLWNNSFVGNASSGWGGAYYAAWYAYGDVRGNIFAASASGTGTYGADPYDEPYTTLAYNGWSENLPIDAGGYFSVESGTDGNLSADPGFVAYSADADCANDDLRLATGSAYRDAGDPAVLDPDGTTSDLGAWGGPGAPVEDQDADGYDTTADCDDTNAAISPVGAETCGDGLDQDCDGADLACDTGLPEDTGDTADSGEDTADSGEDSADSGAPGDTADSAENDTSEKSDTTKTNGCGCHTGGGGGWAAALLALALTRRRTQRGIP